jgi:hypothetical protein
MRRFEVCRPEDLPTDDPADWISFQVPRLIGRDEGEGDLSLRSLREHPEVLASTSAWWRERRSHGLPRRRRVDRRFWA